MDALAGGELGVAPPTTVGLVGHSRGGGVAVLQAARDPRVQALVTWAAISTRRALVAGGGDGLAAAGA